MVNITKQIYMVISYDWDALAEQTASRNGEATQHLYNHSKFSRIRSLKEKERYLNSHYRITCLISLIEGKPIHKTQFKIFAIPCKLQKANEFHNLNFPLTTQTIKNTYLENHRKLLSHANPAKI